MADNTFAHYVFYWGWLLGLLISLYVLTCYSGVLMPVGLLIISDWILLQYKYFSSEVGYDIFVLFNLMPQLLVVLLLELVLLFELIIFILIKTLPITFRKRVNILLPSPIPFSLERIPLQSNLRKFPLLTINFLS